jgi:hypothetical protein
MQDQEQGHHVGMTRAEVCAILGEHRPGSGSVMGAAMGSPSRWKEGPNEIVVVFTPDNSVATKDFRSGTVWRQVRFTLGKCWRKPVSKSY